VSVKRLRQLGVVAEINYQPFDAEGHVVDSPSCARSRTGCCP